MTYLGRALGGRPAQALGHRMLLCVSKDAFLRGAVGPTESTPSQPGIVGIDDWAWRKGQGYGTLICDLEPHAVIDLLPDREIVRMMTTSRHHLSKSDSILVTQVEHALPALSQARRLLDFFTLMVRNGECAVMAGHRGRGGRAGG